MIWELIFYLLRTFCPHLGSFCVVSSSLRFGQISPLTFFRWLTATSDRNAESCNPSNYIVVVYRTTGLGRNWNCYLLTMLTWNRKDSTPLSAAPWAPKGDQGWIFWSYKSNYLFSLSGVQQLWKAVITGETQHSYLRSRLIT